MGNEENFTETFLQFVTSTLERIDDPKIVADVAIGAIMVLCKKLMYKEVEDEME